jgi:spore coat polysaccharide biosynthesis protein SpsF
MSADYVIVVQARMSSARFPGKVLASLHGTPILAHVLNRLSLAVSLADIVVATSDEVSDDPVAAYAPTLGVDVVRGPLDDVLERFRMCARLRPRLWVGRVNADSPLLDATVVRRVLEARDGEPVDLVTTVFPRTFPIGQNVELIRTDALMRLRDEELTPADREHVTRFFYRHPDRFSIRNIESGEPSRSGERLAVDTIDDLRRLETLSTVQTG